MNIPKFLKNIIFFFIYLLAFSTFNSADKVEALEFRDVSPCHGTAATCAPYIVASGEIQVDDDKKLDNYLKKEGWIKLLNSNASFRICFNSKGGNMLGAIKLGEYIRSKNIDTCLLESYENVEIYLDQNKKKQSSIEEIADKPVCASACFFAFVGGINRIIEDFDGDTYLGVHQFFSDNKTGNESNAQSLSAYLSIYLDRMDIDRSILDYASLTPPDQITYLPISIISEYKIDTTRNFLVPWNLEIIDDNQLVGFVSQRHSNKNAITKLILSNEGTFSKLYIVFSPQNNRSQNEILDILNSSYYHLELYLDNENIFKQKTVWKHINNNKFLCSVNIPKYILLKIKKGKALNLKYDVANAYRDIEPSTKISLEGFNKVYLALFN